MNNENEIRVSKMGKSERLVLLNALVAMGFTIHNGDITPEKFLRAFHNSHSVTIINLQKKDINGTNWCGYAVSPEEALMKAAKAAFASPPVIIELNEEYKAEVTADAVRVGCQTFPARVIYEVAAALQSLQ